MAETVSSPPLTIVETEAVQTKMVLLLATCKQQQGKRQLLDSPVQCEHALQYLRAWCPQIIVGHVDRCHPLARLPPAANRVGRKALR